MNSIIKLTKGILEEPQLIFKLAKNDFKAKYSNSFLGITSGVLVCVSDWI